MPRRPIRGSRWRASARCRRAPAPAGCARPAVALRGYCRHARADCRSRPARPTRRPRPPAVRTAARRRCAARLRRVPPRSRRTARRVRCPSPVSQAREGRAPDAADAAGGAAAQVASGSHIDRRTGRWPAIPAGRPGIRSGVVAGRRRGVRAGGRVRPPAIRRTPPPPGTRPRSCGTPGSGRGGHRRPASVRSCRGSRPAPGQSVRAAIRLPAGRGRRSDTPAGTGRTARSGRPALPAGRRLAVGRWVASPGMLAAFPQRSCTIRRLRRLAASRQARYHSASFVPQTQRAAKFRRNVLNWGWVGMSPTTHL